MFDKLTNMIVAGTHVRLIPGMAINGQRDGVVLSRDGDDVIVELLVDGRSVQCHRYPNEMEVISLPTETPTERWIREAVERKDCQQCNHCGWEPDSDLYCGHPEAFSNVSVYGASFNAMDKLGLCTGEEKQLWEQCKS